MVRRVTPLRVRTGSILGLDIDNPEPEDSDPGGGGPGPPPPPYTARACLTWPGSR